MTKPYIKVQHIVLEAIGLISTVIAAIYAIVIAVTVEGGVPTHYNMAGEIDGYGPASSILAIPLIILPVVIMMILLLHLLPPSKWNIPTKINPGREIPVFIHLVFMVAEMTAEMGIFTLLETLTFLNPNNSGVGLSFLLVGAMAVSTIVHSILSTKANRV